MRWRFHSFFYWRAFVGEQPFQKLRFRITAIAAELGAAVVTTGNHFSGNAMPVTSPGGKLHVPPQFFHLSEKFLIALDWANLVLVPMKGPYRDILNQ